MAMKKLCILGSIAVIFIHATGFSAEARFLSTAENGFGIYTSELEETSPAVAYNFKDDVFLVVTTIDDSSSMDRDLYGQFVGPDGVPRGNRFPICLDPSAQYYPDLAYGKNNEFIVVWYDRRSKNGNIYGARLNASGKKLKNTNTLADTTFVICDQDSNQYAPRIAHNPVDNSYLVVWEDYRNSVPAPLGKRMPKPNGAFVVNADVYGQRLDDQGLPIAPQDPPSTKVNFPVSVDSLYDEYYQDITFCGGGDRPDEWMVVFTKYNYNFSMFESPLVWGVRIDGKTGSLLDTWGNPASPHLSKAAGLLGEPPWFPQFPVSSPEMEDPQYLQIYRGSPHVESNTGWLLHTGQAQARHPYPVPECLVAWTEYPHPSKIKAQRLAYFPDSTAYRKHIKPTRGTDGQFTLVPLDSVGNPAVPWLFWITWKNMFVTNGAFQAEYNNISYNPIEGDYLVVWNDWRSSGWNGSFPMGGPYLPPHADIYGQRLYLSKWDSTLIFLDQSAAVMTDRYANIPIVFTNADEGNWNYPGIAYGYSGDRFLIAYEYEQDNDDIGIDVQGVMFGGLPTAVRNRAEGNTPGGFILAGNYPNPFNPGTTIGFRLAAAGRTRVKVLDALGRDVITLSDGIREAGHHEVRWDGMDGLGNPAASGVYFYKILSGTHATVGKMLLLR